MWVKIETIPSDEAALYLPFSLYSGEYPNLVRFGTMTMKAVIKFNRNLDINKETSCENPAKAVITKKLQNLLMIPGSLVFQIKITGKQVEIGPVIGLLLGYNTSRYTPQHMTKYSDRLGVYDKVGGLIYAFSPVFVNWKHKVTKGLFYNIKTSSWQVGAFPLPDVIYRRDFHSNPRHIERLSEITQGRLFNSYRFSKYQLYRFAQKDKELRNYLPPTELSQNWNQVLNFIDTYQKVILKPTDLSRGRGICVIEKTDAGYLVTDYRSRNSEIYHFENESDLENFFEVNSVFFYRYLIQKYLPLAQIKESFFDVRVVMQKGVDHKWGCTGIECRVSKEHCHLTNISRGGYALSLDEALRQSFTENYDELPDKIDQLCRKVCLYLEKAGEHFAEFGVDIAIDRDKNIWLIEANVFPSFKGFKRTDRKTYDDIRYTPLLYALSLTPFAKDDN